MLRRGKVICNEIIPTPLKLGSLLGWTADVPLREGLERTVKWYLVSKALGSITIGFITEQCGRCTQALRPATLFSRPNLPMLSKLSLSYVA